MNKKIKLTLQPLLWRGLGRLIKDMVIIGIIIILLSSCKTNNKVLYDNSVCWEISRGDTNVSYVLGSIHILDTTKIDFPVNQIKDLIDRCANFCIEVDTKSINSLNQDKFYEHVFISDTSLNIIQALDEEYYEKLMRMIDVSKTELKYLKPVISKLNPGLLLFLVVGENQLGKSELYEGSNFFMDSYFEEYSISKNYTIHGLETYEEQLDMILNTSLEETIEAIKESIDNYFADDSETTSIDMIKNYKNNNLKLLQPEGYTDPIMILRNKNMAEGIDKLIQSEPVFVIIGAAHLPYEYGVLNLLKNKGYTIKPYPLVISAKD